MGRRAENCEMASHRTLDRGFFPQFLCPQQNKNAYQLSVSVRKRHAATSVALVVRLRCGEQRSVQRYRVPIPRGL